MSYCQKVKALLDFNTTPDDFSVREYLANKQRSSACSGTLANYVKAFRSFFNYLFENQLYAFDALRLKQPKIKYKECRVPKDDDIAEIMRNLDKVPVSKDFR